MQPTEASPRASRTRRIAAALCVDVLRAAILLVTLHLFVFQFSIVRGSSMQPNIHDGDRLLVDRVSMLLGDIGRFDVVILESPKDEKIDYVKRVVGMPGDRISLRRGQLYVNGALVDEPFACFDDTCNLGTIRVPEHHFFVLGDNRPVSCDSREGWFVPQASIKGKVRACVWPLDHLKSL